MVKQWRQSWLLAVAGEQLSEQWWLESGTQHWDSAKVFFYWRGHRIFWKQGRQSWLLAVADECEYSCEIQ